METDRSLNALAKGWMIGTASKEGHLRVRGRSLLVVKAVYPILTPGEDENGICAYDDAAERFNRCYAMAAEAFVRGGLAARAPQVQREFEALGAGESFMFLRRQLSCHMTVAVRQEAEAEPLALSERVRRIFKESSVPPEIFWLEVCIEQTYGARVKGVKEEITVGRHIWQFPRGLLTEQSPKYKKSYEKLLKNQG